jgi:dCMP deaminase
MFKKHNDVMKNDNITWDQYFISEAYLSARKSKDNSTQVGAVIVGLDKEIRSKGNNGPCRGEDDNNPSIYERPLKYDLFEHAERNAIYNAARIGVSCKNSKIYVTMPPCVDCARAIIQSGISELILHKQAPNSTNWNQSQKTAYELLERCGVQVRFWSGVPLIDKILCNGEYISLQKNEENDQENFLTKRNNI